MANFAVAAYAVSLRWRALGRRLGALAAVVALVFGLTAGAKAYYQYGRDMAIVTEGDVMGRAAPRADAAEEFELPAGLRVRSLHHPAEGWSEIRLPDGSRTFLPSDAIRLL